MIKRSHLLEHVIRPTLSHLKVLNSSLSSRSAENLLLGTILQESSGGTYLKQINGPALGIFQIEPSTHADVYDNFFRFKPQWENTVVKLASKNFYNERDDELIFNLRYSCAIARVIYWRVSAPLPSYDDVAGLAEYWKRHYNTVDGAGTVEQFIESYAG